MSGPGCLCALLIPPAAQARKYRSALPYDWFLDVSITLLERVMCVTGGLFMELFRVMVKALLNTQAGREGLHAVRAAQLSEP